MTVDPVVVTLHPSQQPEPRPNGGKMPADFRPTPPTPEARARFARKRVAETDDAIDRARAEGNRERVFELTDRRSRLAKQAADYDRLAAWLEDHPDADRSPKRVTDRTVVLPAVGEAR